MHVPQVLDPGHSIFYVMQIWQPEVKGSFPYLRIAPSLACQIITHSIVY